MKRTGTARIISRRSAWTLALTLALVGALANTLPAQAGAPADPGAPNLPKLAASAPAGVSNSTPDAAKRPAGSQQALRKLDGTAMKLGTKDAGAATRRVDGTRAEAPGCTPYISGYVTRVGLDVRIDYLAEIVCNFYLAGAGQAYLIERTTGSPYDGQVVAAAGAFSFGNDYYGYSLGAVLIDGRVYDGGSQMEIGFNLALQTLDGSTWAGCFALPAGQRYLSACAGLGTPTISVAVGSGVFGTGLAPNRLAVLASLTQTGSDSYAAWDAARQNQALLAAYMFDWSNDGCTGAPDNPLGFAFELSCIRHDFGYRNYKAAQRFAENKDRLDLAFYGDMQRVCATYSDALRPPCYGLATVYYEAVRIFGRPNVTAEQLKAAEELMPEGTAGKAPLAETR
ncbi:phospholipase [Plantactinospora sp. KLBMP9567]|uniref:phospholipase n=1 Tax=Plantactinospora sp. KLBMP9567 TaxID=3085900 RepID=UPI002980D06F|nr:phospholipase [Plantactinospora sp. KLBMP9567]MDW5324241.1 phospholipase [Plantactinospora sp. KLBMP9567]